MRLGTREKVDGSATTFHQVIQHLALNQKTPDPNSSAPPGDEAAVKMAQSRPGGNFLESAAFFRFLCPTSSPDGIFGSPGAFPMVSPFQERGCVQRRCWTLQGSWLLSSHWVLGKPVTLQMARPSSGTCRGSEQSPTFLPTRKSGCSHSHQEPVWLIVAKYRSV